MENCQPQQAIETGRKTPETNDQEANHDECHDNVCEEEASQSSFSRPLMGHQLEKGNMYLHQRIEKNLEEKLRVS